MAMVSACNAKAEQLVAMKNLPPDKADNCNPNLF
jgi:hypothetical protein